MKAEDIGVIIFALVMIGIYVGLIALGISIAKRKHRSPHWMWFALHPLGLIITLIVLASLTPLKECPQCGERVKQYARLCAYCGNKFDQAA